MQILATLLSSLLWTPSVPTSLFLFLSICFQHPLLGARLQMGLMTWDGYVKLEPWRICEHLLFKQLALDSLGCFYLYSFNGLYDKFNNQFLLPKLPKNDYQLVPCSFPLLPPRFPTSNNYRFDLYISTVRSTGSLAMYKETFLTKHT